MLTKIIKWITMTVLLTAAANSQFPQLLMGCLVCFGAGVIALQAVQVLPFRGEWRSALVLASTVPLGTTRHK